MSNAHAKGKRFERRCKKYLESIGFAVDQARAAVKFIGPGKAISSPCDFLGFADLLAVRADKNYCLFVQAHAGTSTKPRQQKAEGVAWNLDIERIQLWQPLDDIKGGIRTLWLRSSGFWQEFIWRMKHGEEPVGGML